MRTRKNKQKRNNKIIDSNASIPVIILNANDMNTPKNRDWQSGYKNMTLLQLEEIHFKNNDLGRLKLKGWQRYIVERLIKRKEQPY